MQKVIAYYMHESELALASSLMSDPVQTDSYLIGNVEESAIEELRKNGIVIKVLDDKPKRPPTPGNTHAKSVFTNHTGGFFNILDIAGNAERTMDVNIDFPAYFILTIDVPLIDKYKKDIESLGARFSQYLGDNAYVIWLTEDVTAQLRDLSFVSGVEYFTAADTGVNVLLDFSKERSLPQFFSPAPFIKFDLLLHHPSDKEALLQWLNEQNIKVLGSSPYKIRIEVNRKSLDMELLASNKMVQSVEEYVPPGILNDLSRLILQIDENNSPGTSFQLGFEGEGQIVGIADTGIDDTHPAFSGQILAKKAWGRPGDTSDPSGHGTHVSGSVAGNGAGSDGLIKGTAPKAKIFFQSILKADGKLNIPVDLSVLFAEAYQAGARVHNNSWGAATKSRYTASSVEVDAFIYNNKDMLVIFSAGNDGKGFQNKNVANGFTDLLSIGSPATAKNALTVGASRSSRTKGGYSKLTYGTVWQESFPFMPTKDETVSGNIESLAAFSSRGPVDDERRIKPDLVAPGTDIASAFSKDADLSDFCGIHPRYDQYAIMCGTSMSAPLVAGCAALVREYYVKTRNHLPSAALLKATLINGARILSGIDANEIAMNDLGGTPKNIKAPHFHQGFGLLEMMSCIPGKNAKMKLEFRDTYLDPSFQIKTNGQKFRFDLQITTASWVKICLVYTDPPARGLQHNLVLLVDFVGKNKKWAGNDFLPKHLQVTDPSTDLKIDLHNNVQAVQIDNAETGLYSVQVLAHNVWRFPQDFALVVTSGDLNFSFTNR